jgi:membrane-associated protease RseP (regulator of RpoE activity)
MQDFRALQTSNGWREWVLPALLFLATLLSTTYAGLFYAYGDVGFLRLGTAVAAHPTLLLQGISFSFTLMAILLAHEMGHYLACRHYGIRCTPPFFIPFPISFFVGTLGAFIRIKSNFQHKRALFDVGIAGPLAGFAFVVPALVIGINRSTLVLKGSTHGDIFFGEPLLFRWLGAVLLGYSPETHDMFAHPIAMAAWFGLLVTSLNLFPIWQLDGGHISYALFGRERQKKVSLAAAVALVLISFAGWPFPALMYTLFATLLILLSMRSRFYHPPTACDDEQIGPGRVALGIFIFLILVVSFTPVPIYVM